MKRLGAAFLVLLAELAGCVAPSAPIGHLKPQAAASAPPITAFPDRVMESVDLDHWGHKAFALLPKPMLIQHRRPTNASLNRVVVKVYDEELLHSVAAQYCSDCEIEDIHELQAAVVTFPDGLDLDEKVQQISQIPGVAYAERDGSVDTQALTPNDPELAINWGLGTIRATESWSVTTSKPQITIAILDTGIDQDHVEFQDKIVANKNFTTSPTVDDVFFHGTHVAGIASALADNATGSAGAAPCATLMNVKVLGDTGSGQFSWIASGITWAADNGAKVINLSLGSFTPSQLIQDAVNYAHGKGVVVVAAAGNFGVSQPFYPAYYSNVIAVGAVDQNGAKASFSNHGTWVDIAAPGVDIYSTLPNHPSSGGQQNFGKKSGTSMAAPFVAGVAAQVMAVSSPNSVRSRLESTAIPIPGTGTYWMNGRVDAYDAVRAP